MKYVVCISNSIEAKHLFILFLFIYLFIYYSDMYIFHIYTFQIMLTINIHSGLWAYQSIVLHFKPFF